jgi:hypothetical protein
MPASQMMSNLGFYQDFNLSEFDSCLIDWQNQGHGRTSVSWTWWPWIPVQIMNHYCQRPNQSIFFRFALNLWKMSLLRPAYVHKSSTRNSKWTVNLRKIYFFKRRPQGLKASKSTFSKQIPFEFLKNGFLIKFQ